MVLIPTKHELSAVGVIGDKIYIGDVHSTECYDTVSNKCVTVSGQSARNAGYCVYQNKLYVAGGCVDANKVISTLQCYDPISDEWTMLADMSTARAGLSLVVYNDRLWVIGGTADGYKELDALESYDVQQNKWRSEQRLPLGISGGGAIVL
eukprot:TRINITY_DN4010_c0_g1_i4.p1 TRINITY_DN4010_c0_g1~~TRINITY_DN4010_c0_g1_i4.p1  ORF type:complete len:151 (-),score=38.46 TRINITY_DN4010_c0_g1_i4:934-1386(-)